MNIGNPSSPLCGGGTAACLGNNALGAAAPSETPSAHFTFLSTSKNNIICGWQAGVGVSMGGDDGEGVADGVPVILGITVCDGVFVSVNDGVGVSEGVGVCVTVSVGNGIGDSVGVVEVVKLIV